MYDVVVIGGGPGGTRAAIVCASYGKKVALISTELGGECLNYGCIPTKTYLWSAELLEKMREAATFGIEVKELQVNWEMMKKRRVEVVTKLQKNLTFSLERAGVTHLPGVGSIEDTTHVKVANDGVTTLVEAQHIIIATGSEPTMPPGFVFSDRIIGNHELLNLPAIPKNLLIIGGGSIGVEFASLFSALGTAVTIAEGGERLVPQEDADISKELQRIFARKNITILTSTFLKPEDELVTAAEKVLLAVGRTPYTKGLGLEKVGVNVEKNGIPTNDFYQTNVPTIFAIGDVAGKALLAYTAEREGELAAKKICGVEAAPLDYTTCPSTIFSLPEIASVGKTEDELKKEGTPYVVGASPFSANAKALIRGSRDGFAKILAHAETGALLGIHMIGENCCELIAEPALALSAHMTVAQCMMNLHSHPIEAEVLKEAMHKTLPK